MSPFPTTIAATDFPPEFGSLSFSAVVEPVSLQSKKADKRERVKNAIQPIVQPLKYLLSGEVQVHIEWLIADRERYESDSAPDIDNIVKPLIDAVCGKDGLLVDDCQIQAVDCRWIDWNGPQQVGFEFRFMPDEWVPKQGLAFVHIGKNLFMPVNLNEPREAQVMFLDLLEKMIAARDEIERLTGSYSTARRVMPIQQPFHKTRIMAYSRYELSDYRASLTTAMAKRDADH
jgi:Holliday junction resolvase RusA-like endonuclease